MPAGKITPFASTLVILAALVVLGILADKVHRWICKSSFRRDDTGHVSACECASFGAWHIQGCNLHGYQHSTSIQVLQSCCLHAEDIWRCSSLLVMQGAGDPQCNDACPAYGHFNVASNMMYSPKGSAWG